MTDPAGDRLRQFVDARMVIKQIPTYVDLARLSGNSYDAIEKAFKGRPSNRKTLTKLAVPLGVTYIDLFNAREGIKAGAGGDTTVTPVPADLVTALEGQTAAINALVARLDRLLPAERVRKMLAFAAENMPAESPSRRPRRDRGGSPAR